MPESKNTFIQSKMNKDLDGRILPNGQYRDGQNVQISRSEGDDVGALENVLGNEFLSNFGFTNEKLEIIGNYTDDATNTIFLFLTDYTDSSSNQLLNNCSGTTGECYIVSYNTQDSSVKTLVEGNFLNFSKTHPITGISLLEELLFWTDNRNQPRKININSAVAGYYTNEDQISVAKYYPYEPISLLDFVPIGPGTVDIGFNSSMKDKVSKYLPIHTAANVETIDIPTRTLTLVGYYSNIKPNTSPFIYNNGDKITGLNLDVNVTDVDSGVVESITYPSNDRTEIVVSPAVNVNDLTPNDIVYFQRQNPDWDNNWPGDPDYLKNKFIRFSYRFKFEDGEYSLAAPFTQIAFVPEQDGYFIGDNADNAASGPSTTPPAAQLVGQESQAFDSTVLKFMENKINDIGLVLTGPTIGNSGQILQWDQVYDNLRIIEVDILYKEADSNLQLIVDTLTREDFGNTNNIYYRYDYQSRKPWKTVPVNQTTRVNDAVPIRALAQETAGNRIIYGNFIDKHTSPENLNYTIQINEKPILPDISSTNYGDKNYYVQKEYQNHTLKQNRNYQVGIVLSDRYGRQSNVILSSIINTADPSQYGDTIYHPYRSTESTIMGDKYSNWDGTLPLPPTTIDPYTWPGDQLNAIFYSIIPELKTLDGYPGIYSINDGTLKGVNINYSSSESFDVAAQPALIGCVFNIEISGAGGVGSILVEVGASGEPIFVGVSNPGSGWFNGGPFSISAWPPFLGLCSPAFLPQIVGNVITPEENPLGWYSYKFVVKQTQQEYYNVYLPSTLAGYPCDVDGVEATDVAPDPIPAFEYPTIQFNNTSHIVLFGDNINKVPQDLSEVGPVQDKFRSSVRLYGRVENTLDDSSGTASFTSRQFDPNDKWDIVVERGTMSELGLGDITTNPAIPIIPPIFYRGETDPVIGRVETRKQFGTTIGTCNPASPVTDIQTHFGPTLSVYETTPVESNLELFWETTTSGLISELNNSIKNEDNTAPVGITNTNISWSEGDGWNTFISSQFEAANANGNGLGSTCTIELESVLRGDGQPVTNQFRLEETGGVGSGEYQLRLPTFAEAGYVPLFNSWDDSTKNIFYFTLKITKAATAFDPEITITTSVSGEVSNEAPVERGYPSRDQLHALANPFSVNPADQFSPAAILFRSEQGDAGCRGDIPDLEGGIGPNWGRVYSYDTKVAYFSQASNIGGISGEGIPGIEIDLFGAICPPTSLIIPSSCSVDAVDCSYLVPEANPGLNITYFQATNGAYGSDPADPLPRNLFLGEEIVYTISRAYQVSTYFIGTTGNPYNPFELIFGVNSAGFTGMPQHPVYWDFDSSGLQLDPTTYGGGEQLVGQRYNNLHHYWPDIEQYLQTITAVTPIDPNDPATWPDFMKLINGCNTFYDVSYCNSNPLGTTFVWTPNKDGFIHYLGGINNDGIGPTNSKQKFTAFTDPITFEGGASSGYQSPRRGGIFAGDPTTQGGVIWNNLVEANSGVGNGLPGGRYVVTLRATDRNGNGAYWEWDVPVTLPNWCACTSCNDG